MNPQPPPVWPILLLVLPLAGSLASFLFKRGARLFCLLAAGGVLAALVGLTMHVRRLGALSYALGGWQAPLGIHLRADGFSLWLLWTTALVGLGVSLYSLAYFPAGADKDGDGENSPFFWPLFLLLWTGLNGLFLAADLFNIYICLELLGLAAVALAALPGRPDARLAAGRYLLLNMFASLAYLLGVVLLYRQYGTLRLELFSSLSSMTPPVRVALAFLTLGLLLKSALFPLHFWLPPAHAGAPAPVSALLSGLVVKASFYLLLRVWLPIGTLAGAGLPMIFQALGALGAAAMLWGSVQALLSDRLKPLIAYSTIAQMGFLFLVFPLLGTPGGEAARSGALFFLLAHALAKAALFLAAGSIIRVLGGDRLTDLTGIGQKLPLTSFALALGSVSLMGLPPSSGFIGKWYLLHAALTSGRWWWAAVIAAGTLLTVAYLLRAISRTFARPPRPAERLTVPGIMEWTPFALAFACLLVGLFPSQVLDFLGGELADPLAR